MRNILLRFVLKHWPVLILSLTSLLLCVLNYTPSTYLSGWDTLHPEFNFPLNLKRVLSGVFRPEQGLGAVAVHSHMVELPRILILWLADFVLPNAFLRYFWTFLMLVIGPIGMFYLVKKTLQVSLTRHHEQTGLHRLSVEDNEARFVSRLRLPWNAPRYGHRNRQAPNDSLSSLAAFLAGSWYLLNLGTLQQFVVPFEMFVTQYGFLPWLFLFALSFLHAPSQSAKRSALLLFALCALLASPMAYAATLWYMFFGFFILFLLCYSFPSAIKKNFVLAKRSITLLIVTLLSNAYWLLPNLYFLATQSKKIQEANINKLFSEQAFLYNKEFGTLTDTLLLKSFFFDWSIYNGRSFEPLLRVWSDHLQNPFILSIGFLMATIMLLGIGFAIAKAKRIGFALAGMLFFLLIFLFNDNAPFGSLFHSMQTLLPILKEALRFPHNKVYVIYMLVFSLFFGFGNYAILEYSNQIREKLRKKLLYAYCALLFALLCVFMFPAFRGQLINPLMRVSIPQSYFALFDFMNKQDDGRAAYLPVHSFWGWEYHAWSDDAPAFQGAGFLWFGMKQSLLHRDFDRWSTYNEQSYRELSYAVYSKNAELLHIVANKYAIKYFILDESIIAPGEDQTVLYYSELNKLLADKTLFTKKASFGDLSVHEVNEANSSLVSLLEKPQTVSPIANTLYEDFAYTQLGDYVSRTSETSQFNYPFRTQVDNQSKVLSPLFKTTADGLLIEPLTPYDTSEVAYADEDIAIQAPVTLQQASGILTINLYPQLPLQTKTQPLPLTVQAKAPGSTGMTLVVNTYTSFTTTSVNSTPTAIGRVFLPTAKTSTVSIYSDASDTETSVDLNSQAYSIKPCGALAEKQLFGIDLGTNLSIFAKNTPTCLVVPLAEVFPDLKQDESLLRVAISYKETEDASGNDKTTICIANLKTGACKQYLSRIINTASATADQVFATGIKASGLKTLGLRISLDGTETESLTTTSFDKITLSLSQPVFTTAILPELLTRSLAPAQASIENGSALTVPYSGFNDLSRDITTFPKTTGVCQENPLVASGIREKKVVEENEDFIRYTSENGPQCDHFSYPNLPHDQAHLLVVTTRNISGLPLSICVTNRTSKRCDVYAHATATSEFTTEAFLIPPTDTATDGYDVNINNLGVKRTTAINDLHSIEIIPFPYRWVGSSHSGQKQAKTTATDLSSEAQRQHKIVTSLPQQISHDNVLVLNSSFQEGWKAYLVDSTCHVTRITCYAQNLFPFLFGSELKEHVLVNNWANGWLLNDASRSAHSATLVILFWPQYLFSLGLMLTIVTVSTLAIRSYVRKRRH